MKGVEVSTADWILFGTIALLVGDRIRLAFNEGAKPLTPKDEAAWLDFAIRTKRAELAEARKHHRPSADLQRELSDLIAKKLRAETAVRKGFFDRPESPARVSKNTPKAPRLQRRRAF